MNYSDYITQATARRERERQLTARYNQKPNSKKLQNVFKSPIKITSPKVNNLEAVGVVVFFVIMVTVYLILK